MLKRLPATMAAMESPGALSFLTKHPINVLNIKNTEKTIPKIYLYNHTL